MVLHMRVHHGVLWRRRRVALRGRQVASCTILVIVVLVSTGTLVRKIRRPFVLVCAAIVLEATNDLVDVRRRVFIQLLVVAKDNDGDVDGAEDGELVCLLEQAALALQEGDGSVAGRGVSMVWAGQGEGTAVRVSPRTDSYHRE